jgi:hypothetical protein
MATKTVATPAVMPTDRAAQDLLVFGVGLALTGGSLALLRDAVAGAPRAMELSVLVLANLAATVLRFVLLRLWMAHRR